MNREEWLLLEALFTLVLPVFLVGMGIAIALISIFHRDE